MLHRNKRNFVLILSLMMIFMFSSVFTVSAGSKTPGQVKISSVSAAKASVKTGKGTVTVKWKKAARATGYQIYVRQPDGDWTRVRTVKGNKTSASFKAYAGSNTVRIRAIRRMSTGTLKGQYSKTRKIRVNSSRTLQKYMKSHPKEYKKIKEKSADTGVSIKVRDNDLIYTYDISSLCGSKKEALEYKDDLESAAEENSGVFENLCSELNISVKTGGIRVIVKYMYKNTLIVRLSYR